MATTAVKCWAHPCPVLNAGDVQLHGDVKTMKKIPTKYKRIHWCVHCM